MGLFDSSETKDKKAQEKLKKLLLPEEEVKYFRRTLQDYVAVTDRRIILCDLDFDWGDTKKAIVSVKLIDIKSLTITDGVEALKKYKVSVSGSGFKATVTFYDDDVARNCYLHLAKLIF